jgi:putative membrane protein
MTTMLLALLGSGGGLAIVWGLTGALLWILPIALIVLAVWRVRTSTGASRGPAVRLLEERYARGEITREEFLELRAVLGRGSPSAPSDDSP